VLVGVRLAVAAETAERDEEDRAETSSGGGGHTASGADDSIDAASSLLRDSCHWPPSQATWDAGQRTRLQHISAVRGLLYVHIFGFGTCQ